MDIIVSKDCVIHRNGERTNSLARVQSCRLEISNNGNDGIQTHHVVEFGNRSTTNINTVFVGKKNVDVIYQNKNMIIAYRELVLSNTLYTIYELKTIHNILLFKIANRVIEYICNLTNMGCFDERFMGATSGACTRFYCEGLGISFNTDSFINFSILNRHQITRQATSAMLTKQALILPNLIKSLFLKHISKKDLVNKKEACGKTKCFIRERLTPRYPDCVESNVMHFMMCYNKQENIATNKFLLLRLAFVLSKIGYENESKDITLSLIPKISINH
jgi:hypothetical protein